jgi:pimeloyl-ACP methyl ester carboxylesterase
MIKLARPYGQTNAQAARRQRLVSARAGDPVGGAWRDSARDGIILGMLQTNARMWPLPKGARLAARCCRFAAVILLVAGVAGCSTSTSTPRVIYLDGAGWLTSAGSVKAGLKDAGYEGAFETFTWTSFLGAPADHLLTTRSNAPAKRLANRITQIRKDNPEGAIHVMGLSAGTEVVLAGLEELPADVKVDHVVLFSSSASARRSLSQVLPKVRGRLYATCSRHDKLLASLAVNADGTAGRSAGQRGFRLARGLSQGERALYNKVVNLRWRPEYAGFGWNGGHLRATSRRFVAAVIAPRIMSREPFPLDRPMVLPAAGTTIQADEDG